MKRARDSSNPLPPAKAARHEDAASPLDISELVAEEIVTWVGPATHHAMRFVCKRWHAWLPPALSLTAVTHDILEHGYARLFFAWPAYFTEARLRPLLSGVSTNVALSNLWASAVREKRLDWIPRVSKAFWGLSTFGAPRLAFDNSVLCAALFEVDVPWALSSLHAIRVALTLSNHTFHASMLLQYAIIHPQEEDGLIDALVDELRVSGHYREKFIAPLLGEIETALIACTPAERDQPLAWRLIEMIGLTWRAQSNVRAALGNLLGHLGPLAPLVRIWEHDLTSSEYHVYQLLSGIADISGPACEATPLYDWKIQWTLPFDAVKWLEQPRPSAAVSGLLLITHPDRLGPIVTAESQWAWIGLAMHAPYVAQDTWRALFRLFPWWCKETGATIRLPLQPFLRGRKTTLLNFLATVPFEQLAPDSSFVVDGQPVRPRSPVVLRTLAMRPPFFIGHPNVLAQLVEIGATMGVPNPITERIAARCAEVGALVVDPPDESDLLRDMDADTES